MQCILVNRLAAIFLLWLIKKVDLVNNNYTHFIMVHKLYLKHDSLNNYMADFHEGRLYNFTKLNILHTTMLGVLRDNDSLCGIT